MSDSESAHEDADRMEGVMPATPPVESDGENDIRESREEGEEPASSPVKKRSRAVSDDESGEDVSKPSGLRHGMYSDEDESEESEEEETEADRHFIVDDAEDDAEEQEPSSAPHRRRRKKRRRSLSDSESDLDADDLDLVHENTGGSKKFKRLRRKVDDDNVGKIFSDEDETPIRADNQRDGYDEDDMDDFIIDDEEGEGAEVDRAEKLAQRKKERASLGQNLGRNLGISDEQWRDAQHLFDFEVDYGWAMHGKTEDALDLDENDEDALVPKNKAVKLTDLYEPSEIEAKMLTDQDEIIRVNDIPERFQLRGDMPVPESGELERAAVYIGRQLFVEKHIAEEPVLSNPRIQSILKVLEYMRGEDEKQERAHFEVPFILAHRRDYVQGLLDRNDLWRVYDLDFQFVAFEQKKANVLQLYKDIAKMSSLAAEETYVPEMLERAQSIEDITDVSQYIQLRFGTELAQAEHNRRPTFKRARRVTPYDVAKAAGIGELVQLFSCDARQIGASVTASSLKNEVPDVTPEEAAKKYVTARGAFPNPQRVLEGARLMLATEMAADPTFRAFVRKVYTSDAILNIAPTKKGGREIDHHHPFYPFKFLTGKFLWEFTDGQFLQIMEAEQKELITVEIKISAEDEFFNDVVRRSSFNSGSAADGPWNEQILKVLNYACREILFPQIVRWQKERLASAAKEHVALHCQLALEKKIETQGFVKKIDADHVDEWEPRVLAISWGEGAANASTYAVVLNETGGMLQWLKLDQFRGPPEYRGRDVADLIKMIARHQPDVIAIAGMKPNTKTILHRQLDDILQEALAAREIKTDLRIFFVDDDVARIYMNSERAIREFPEKSHPPLVRYLVSLARRVQEPTMEFAGLYKKDISRLKLDPLQALIPEEKFEWAVEKAFVNVVNKIGVDINVAAQQPHRATTLQFVAGLGPRKAQAFLAKISRGSGGRLEARAQLIRKSLCGKRIFMNCASFIRVRARNFSKYEANLEVLDDTRIHPEDYDLARKMAADALEYDESAIADEEDPSVHVTEIMESERNLQKLAHLDIDEFAEMLERRMKERKRMVLQDIMNEIIHPFRDNRPPFTGATPSEIFAMLTHETDETLADGSIVSVQVVRVLERLLKCKLNNGLDGLVHISKVPLDRGMQPTSLVGMYNEDTLLQARVLKVDKEKMAVELSLRDVGLDPPPVKVDPKFDRRREEDEITAQRNIDVRKAKSKQVRQIQHPYFKLMDFKTANAYLADKQPGAVVIRPSTKGNDHFSITWKVDEGCFAHVDVVETNKENDMALGEVLTIEGERFSEIDQIIAEYIEPTSRRVQSMFAHPKYQRKNREEMDRFIADQCSSTRRSAYGLILDREQPCHFFLIYKHPTMRPHKESVVVKHKGYVFRKRMFSSVDELLRYFKEDEARRAQGGGDHGRSSGASRSQGSSSSGHHHQTSRPHHASSGGAPPPGSYGRAPAPGHYAGRA
ncbi:Transcription elongation factor spt6 [Geranomyces variabilis]|nr:Transcription elongation factor spt6 [Geranomyces variabilis]